VKCVPLQQLKQTLMTHFSAEAEKLYRVGKESNSFFNFNCYEQQKASYICHFSVLQRHHFASRSKLLQEGRSDRECRYRPWQLLWRYWLQYDRSSPLGFI